MINQMAFTKQIIRNDVLFNMLNNNTIKVKELYHILMTDNNTIDDDKRKGFLFETISIILLISKCLVIDYTNILSGQLQSLKVCKNINKLLKINIRQGDNPTDITIKQGNTIIPISIKYKNKFLPNMSSVSEIDGEISKIKNINKYMIGLIVRDKTIVEKHNYKNEGGNQKILHDKVIEDKLLLDENDIIKGLELFCNNFKNYKLDDFIEMINNDYLLSGRDRLKLKLHQKMTFIKFIRTKKQTLHLISHKPRSGKSITILNICKHLLENGTNKILVMTSIPATIKSFIEDLDKYIDFKDIKYKEQDNFKYIKNKFKGIVFCSVQYLKTDVEEKKLLLKNLKFDVMIIDECHMGSSTKKTENDILNADIENINMIRNNIKINIFASGTSDKTKKFYKIKNVYCWDIEDEGYMKRILSDEITENERTDILNIMKNRHGEEFIECFNDNTLNKDYSKSPTQVLMKHMIPENIITEIKEYNAKNNTNYGYSCSSIFALDKVKNKKTGKYEYINKFELEKSSDGTEILKSFFECVISNNKMNKTTIMKKIEETQSTYKSRISQKGDPKLFLMYLPTHTGNNNISQLQITFKQFIEKHKLWTDYNIEYSNSIDDSSDTKEEYNTYIKTILDKSKTDNMKGCVLLLGNKGGVGITYHECDVTISLDDGHNLDNQRQRYSRALTEGINKMIGINVDMNIQRTYLYVNDVIHKHRTNTKTTKTNGEILKYLYEHNIFLFNPSDINNGNVKTFVITEYYNKEAENILKNIDDTNLLNEIIVVDDDIILDKDEIGLEFNWNETTNQLEPNVINHDLEGEQPECPKGDITKNYIDNIDDVSGEKLDEPLTQIEEDKIEKQKQILKEICKRVLFPLLALLSRTFIQLEFKEMLFHDNTKEIINEILKNKKIILNKNLYNSIIRIIENNNEIINNIREIYRTAPADKIHQLIAKHFIPSIEEKKNNAEIPTPLELVNEMLSKILQDFWKTPKLVFEPCCGKGNFVMKIFENFYIGLSELYPDENERCKVIITDCLYFADLTPMNIFITTEILKCEIQSKTGIEEINYKFNSYAGDTLGLDIKKIFNIDNFDAVIGNPPYNDDSGNKGKGHMLWDKFVIISLNKFVKKNGYLVYVHPAVWRQYEHPCLDILKNKQILYLEIHNVDDGQKTFRCATRYDWYVLLNKKNMNNTIIKGEDGIISEVNLKEWDFIPNMMFDEIKKLISSNDKLDVWRYRSIYGTENKKLVSKNKNDTFKYSLVYTINKQNIITFRYTNDNTRGHFGKSKFIFSNGAGFYCDSKGEYGLTEWAYCIYDEKDKLSLIEKAFRSNRFNKIKEAIHLDSSSYNIKVMKLFKKDFYNDFINEPEENIITEIKQEIIQKGRSKYYLIDNKLYKINKNKSQGEFYSDYIKTDTINEPKIIKDGRKQYYLVNEKLYKVQKDKSQGELFGSYINNKIVKDEIQLTISDKLIIETKQYKLTKAVNKKSIIEPLHNDIIVKTHVKRKSVKKNIII